MPLDSMARSDGSDDVPLLRFDARTQPYDERDREAVADALRGIPGMRQDAENSVFFTRALEFVKASTYLRPLPPLAGRQLVPVSNEVPASAESITYTVYDGVGVAKIIAAYSDDLPRVDIRGAQVTVGVRTIGDSYGYNTHELRAAAAGGSALPTRRATAARNAVERKHNSLIIKGDTVYNMFGITNHPNISAVVPTTGNWATATGDQILADVQKLLNAIVTQSNGAHNATQLAMSSQARLYFFTKQVTATPTRSVASMIAEQYPGLNIVVAQELQGAGTAGANVVFAAERSAEHFYYEEPMPFTQHPPQARNLEFVVPCESRTAGLIVVNTMALAKMEGV